MTVYLQEWRVYDFIKDERGIGTLKPKTVIWDNRVFKPSFVFKDLEMTVKDLILKLQEFDSKSQVNGTYEWVDNQIIIKIKVIPPRKFDNDLTNKGEIILDDFVREQ